MRPADLDSTKAERRAPPTITVAACALACLAVSGGSAARAETRIVPSLAVDGGFTDNVRGSPKGTEEGDVFSSIEPSVSITNSSGRTSLNLQYGLGVDRYRDSQDLNEERHNLRALGSVDVIRNQVSVDTTATISRLVNNRAGPVTAVDRNLGSNQTDTLLFNVSPSYVTNISNWAVSRAQYSFSQTVFDPFGNQPSGTAAGGDSATNSVNYNLGSGRLFSRLGWSIGGNYQRSKPEGGSATNSMTGDVSASYTVNRFFVPNVRVGYDKFKGGGGGNNTSGLSWAMGARITPGPRTSISVEYGRDFDDNHVQGQASFRVTPSITITASSTHQFALEQQQINNGLQNLTVDENGNFIDSTTGLPFSPTTAGSDLSEVNSVTRTQTYLLALSGIRGRNSYGVTSSLNEQSNGVSGRKTTTLSSSASFSRSLSPNLSMNMSASITGTQDNMSSDTQTANLGAGLSYRLGNNVTGSTSYNFLQTNSAAAAGDQRENTITARLQIFF